jgi:hypothetical protein
VFDCGDQLAGRLVVCLDQNKWRLRSDAMYGKRPWLRYDDVIGEALCQGMPRSVTRGRGAEEADVRAVVRSGAGHGGADAIDVRDELFREDFLDRPGGHHLSLVQDHHVIAVHRRQVEVVQCHDAREAQARYQGQEVQLMLDVEVVRRFVEEEFARFLGEGAGDLDPLAFTAGERAPGAVGMAGQPGAGERGPDGFLIGDRRR